MNIPHDIRQCLRNFVKMKHMQLEYYCLFSIDYQSIRFDNLSNNINVVLIVTHLSSL